MAMVVTRTTCRNLRSSGSRVARVGRGRARLAAGRPRAVRRSRGRQRQASSEQQTTPRRQEAQRDPAHADVALGVEAQDQR